jgi:hypothetical protein
MPTRQIIPILGAALILVGVGLFVYGLFGFELSAGNGSFGTSFNSDLWSGSAGWKQAERIEMVCGAILLGAGVLTCRRKTPLG